MSDTDEMQYTAEVLRNKGVPVRITVVRAHFAGVPEGINLQKFIEMGGDVGAPSWVAVTGDPDSTPLTEVRHVRFDVNVMADLELMFGSLILWQKAMTDNPMSAIRSSFSVLFDMELRQAGAAMINAEVAAYKAALAGAWALANGVDPQTAAEALTVAHGFTAAAVAANQTHAVEIISGLQPSSPSGSAPGSSSGSQ